ncbi:MAG: class I SAM-dependent methyltransferase [archaeon GB-1867-035]|nr:class I SAM-dependent methyltransferase [Candidatus Culexmicrobium profundum]
MINNNVTKIKLDLMKVFDEISKEFDATRRRSWNEVHLVAKKGTLLIDLGCGSGRNSIAAIQSGSEVLAIDLSRSMLKITLRKAEKINKKYLLHTLKCDLNYLAVKSNSIDSVICLATIHHIPTSRERINALKEIKRIMKPNGKLILSVWAKYQPRFFKKLPKMLWNYITRQVQEFGDIYVPWKTKKGTFQRFYHLFSKRETVKMVKASGLKIIRVYGKSFKSKFFHENHVVIAIKS